MYCILFMNFVFVIVFIVHLLKTSQIRKPNTKCDVVYKRVHPIPPQCVIVCKSPPLCFSPSTASFDFLQWDPHVNARLSKSNSCNPPTRSRRITTDLFFRLLFALISTSLLARTFFSHSQSFSSNSLMHFEERLSAS